MPSAEPPVKQGDQNQSSSEPAAEVHANCNLSGQSLTGVNGASGHHHGQQSALDPDRQLIPADRIEHVEDSAAPIELPTVREFTQNDKINKFLLNSFLQRINETDLTQFQDVDEQVEPEQDFEA
ncbi:uncharacterized protein LOC129762308 [Toxorhynchites rutilus septentrionalis]|uniref:uncharacterized protein LOC129762308 n=1 Tax=Toxorhynchites rutilus septentrionalis TaxID=329112 RepID=UPI002479632E|nr:uncharacterized protein LOC129762308 [Toxorhynchites rutilus septentrionalis]